VEKPTNAVINSICGWMLTGVKYLAWLGGLLIVLPLSLVEILVGLREPDSADFV
jgi:ABC-type multidrug transport system permease subunit